MLLLPLAIIRARPSQLQKNMSQLIDTVHSGGPQAFDLNQALSDGVRRLCTDLHLQANDHPIYRLHGNLLRAQNLPILTAEQLEQIVERIAGSYQLANIAQQGDCDLAYDIPGVSRFRVNIYRQMGTYALAFRMIPQRIPQIEELGLPTDVCKSFALNPRGLVLVTGPTGSGKSTSLAAMINFINEQRPCNIITIEDPIEYRHTSKQARIVQREIGTDAFAFDRALRSALRQDPDVILVGEIRDLETIQTALTAAETGHLVFCTLHTNSAVTTVDRIIDVFPAGQQEQIRMQLSNNLVGILSQTLLPATAETGGGRIIAVEVLVATHGVRNLIREAKTHLITSTLEQSVQLGMQTLDMDLKRLLLQNRITRDTALRACRNPTEFRAGQIADLR